MTLRHLRIFSAVCRLGSVTKAAKSLYVTQPAVSLAIKELEEHYGIKLFERTARSISITEDGRRLLEYAVPIVTLFDDMELAVKNPDAVGEIKIGSSLTIGACLLPGYIMALESSCPGVRAKVVVDNSSEIIKAVEEGRLDVGLVEGSVDSERLRILPFMEDTLVALCAREHPLARKRTISIDEFLSQPLLTRERGSGVRELFDSALALWGRHAEPLWESASTTALLRALEAGLGVSMLPERLAAEALNAGRICRLSLGTDRVKRSFYLILHKKKYLSGSLVRFTQIVSGTESE